MAFKTAWALLYYPLMSIQALVLHCDSNEPIPLDDHTQLKDPRIPVEFTSLVEVCGDYQQGLGFFCASDWQKLQVFTPLSELYNDPNTDYLRELCVVSCLCEDRRLDDDVLKRAGASSATGHFNVDRETGNPVLPAADDQISVNGFNALSNPATLPPWVSQPPVHGTDPAATNPHPRFPTQTVDTSATTAASVNITEAYYVDPYWDKGVGCNGELYGNPIPSDCFNAIQALEDEIPEEDWFDFYRFSHSPSPNNGAEEEELFKTPWSKTIGTCTFSIHLLSFHEHLRSDNDNFDYVIARAGAINRKCVGSGVGGMAKAGARNKGIGLYLTGPFAKFNKYLGINETCTQGPAGVIECAYDPDEDAENKDPNSLPPVMDPTIDKGALQPQCGSSCSSPTDCGDKGDDCLCAYDESNEANNNHAANGFPTSATFGTFTCQIIAAAVAATAASIQLGPDVCRGRCVLEANGTLAIVNSTTDSLAIPAADFSSSPQTCICNCTYASRGCCLATDGVVWEDASQKANTVILGPENHCCDHKTGNWNSINGPRNPADPACLNLHSDGADLT